VTVKIIEEMSKDGIELIRFSERYKPEGTVLILDENYHFAKIARILQGYIFWRTKIEEVKGEG
jgi:hypothetical protein